jgi:hypothetical protein
MLIEKKGSNTNTKAQIIRPGTPVLVIQRGSNSLIFLFSTFPWRGEIMVYCLLFAETKTGAYILYRHRFAESRKAGK